MQQKAPDELDGIEGRLLDLIVIFRVSPSESHAAFFQA